MHKHIADQWVEALRSGEYKQTYGTLRREDNAGNCAYCGLGVLCEISNKGNWFYNGVSTFGYEVGNNQAHGELPEEVKEWAGMGTSIGVRLVWGATLAYLNDRQKYTFDQLADVIESEYKDL